MTKFLNISTDTTLGGASPSDETVSSQKAVKTYVDAQRSDYYGTCATSASTQAKVVVCAGFALATGVSIRVKFTNAETYNGVVTLNVNSTGAIEVKSVGTTNNVRYCWRAGEVVAFTYDGTYWIMEDAALATTTYYGYTSLTNSATSTIDAKALVPAALNSFVEGVIANYPVYSSSATYAVGDRVRYSFNVWECTTAITTAEAWDATHWTALDPIQTQIDNLTPVNDATLTITQGGVTKGTFTANASSNVTIALDAGGGGGGGDITGIYGTSNSAATATTKTVSIPAITSLQAGQIIIVQPSITSTVANTSLQLNNFTAYPMRYNNAAITTTSDSYVWNASFPTIWLFDGTYWRFLAHGVDYNTTYKAMVGATSGAAGTAGLVPAPAAGDQDRVLKGDGTWGDNYHPDLFDHKWADHILDDVSWLRADTFSWQDGGVYEAAYNHLADDISGKSLTSETIAGTTVQFYLADDGHKICPAAQESNVAAIYTATGVAWYYIIDTVNERFKLPRSKHEHYGDRPVIGNGKGLGIYDGTQDGYFGGKSNDGTAGTFSTTTVKNAGDHAGALVNMNPYVIGVSTDKTKSGLISTPVQDTDQYKYLYFYVGNFTQTALENTAGVTTETLNSKADIDLDNVSANGKATAVGWGIPDYDSAVSLSAPTTSYQDYTATKPCMIELLCFYMAGALTYKINNHEYNIGGNTTSNQQVGCLMHIYLDTGDVLSYKTQYTDLGTLIVNRATMFPLKGA